MKLRRTPLAVLTGLAALAAGVLTTTTPLATAAPSVSTSDRAVLTTYARSTWRSMAAMTDPATGLPADNIDGTLRHRDPQQVHEPDQHRRLPVEHRRRA